MCVLLYYYTYAQKRERGGGSAGEGGLLCQEHIASFRSAIVSDCFRIKLYNTRP